MDNKMNEHICSHSPNLLIIVHCTDALGGPVREWGPLIPPTSHTALNLTSCMIFQFALYAFKCSVNCYHTRIPVQFAVCP